MTTLLILEFSLHYFFKEFPSLYCLSLLVLLWPHPASENVWSQSLMAAVVIHEGYQHGPNEPQLPVYISRFPVPLTFCLIFLTISVGSSSSLKQTNKQTNSLPGKICPCPEESWTIYFFCSWYCISANVI